MARYVMSDIHGCLRTFKKALSVVGFSKSDRLILIGDFIDRGPDSKGVIDFILKLQSEGYDIICLKGNHEDFLLKSPYNRGVFLCWMQNGGDACLQSYGHIWYEQPEGAWGGAGGYNAGPSQSHLFWIDKIPQRHWEFFRSLKGIHLEKDYAFVHASLDFEKEWPLTETPEDYYLWERYSNVEVDPKKIGDRKLVTGHTPCSKEKLIKYLETDWIMVDRGCCFPGSNYNHMAILNLDTLEFNFVENIDKLEKDL